MSSSTNSDLTPSTRRDIKKFSKYGTLYTLGVVTETRPVWEPVYRRDDGTIIDTSDDDWANKLNGEIPKVDWEKTNKTLEASYVEFARAQDEGSKEEHPVIVYSTLEGPILGMELYRNSDGVTLQDPCIIRYDPNKSIVHYMPIFNVARTLQLSHSSIRSKQPPAELLIANYPGFVIQNRMYKYQMKPNIPLFAAEITENNAEELVSQIVPAT